MQLLHLLLQEGDGHGASSGSVWQGVDLSLWAHMDKSVVMVPPLVLLLWRPHSRIRLGGAVRQRRIPAIVFPHGAALVVLRLVTLGENKRLLLRTPAVALGSGVMPRGAWARPGCVFVFLQTLHSHQVSAVFVTVYPTVFTVISLFADSPHWASTCVTKRWSLVCGFVEVVHVVEVVAQLGTYGHSPHEVRGNFFTADLSLPVSFVSAEGEGEVGCYFLKVLQ